jgi:hypothetical protein
MDSIIDAIAHDIWILIPLTALSIGVFAVVGGIIGDVAKKRQFERSRREIAAYIAEGSMSPEEGERLLKLRLKEDSVC